MAAPKASRSRSTSYGVATPIRTRRQISPTPLCGKGGDDAERLHLRLAMQPFGSAVEHQQHAPFLGKGKAGDHRRRGCRRHPCRHRRSARPRQSWRCRCRNACRAPAAPRRPPGRAAGRARCAAPRRRRERSGCRSRGPDGRGWPAPPPDGDASGCRGRGTAFRDAGRRARSRVPRPAWPNDAPGWPAVSGSLSGRPMLRKSTAAAAVQVEKAEVQAGRHFYGDGIRHMPPNGCIMDASSEV